MVRVRRQSGLSEFDVPAVEDLSAGRDGDEHRGVSVLHDADGRGPGRAWSRHIVLL
jgi:hypothetical protein